MKEKVYIKIRPSGEISTCPCGADGSITLEEMQEAVGGYIEVIGSAFGRLAMIVNVEGKLRGLPYNPTATAIMGAGGLPGDYIVGTVLLVAKSGADLVGISLNAAENIAAQMRRAQIKDIRAGESHEKV